MSETGSSKVASQLEPGLRRVLIRQIEDLDCAVPGAGLRALQLSRQPLTGSLVFAGGDDVVLSSGYLRGRVSLAGPGAICGGGRGVGRLRSTRPDAPRWPSAEAGRAS